MTTQPTVPAAGADGTDPAAATAHRADGPVNVSRSLILQSALSIVDRDGVAGLSMRRLSDEVGRDPTVLYRHIPNKAALLDGVAEIVLGQLHVDTAIRTRRPSCAGGPDFRRLALAPPTWCRCW